MNIKTGLLGLTITSAFLLMASCGGSESGGGGTSGASNAGTSTGGSNSAGTSNANGGTSNANGGTSNPSAGTSNSNGGARPSGGFSFGGDLSFGGAGFDPSDYICNPKPEVGADCAQGTLPCSDGIEVCYCQAMKWACIDLGGLGEGGGPGGGFGQVECPAQAPMNGDACDGYGACPYGQGKYCGCLGTMWMCN